MAESDIVECKYCYKPIAFQFDHGRGKSYPTNLDGSSHDCIERAKNNAKPCSGCSLPIFWHSSMLGPKGGKIPLDVETSQPHNCPAKLEADNQQGNEWSPDYGSEFRS